MEKPLTVFVFPADPSLLRIPSVRVWFERVSRFLSDEVERAFFEIVVMEALTLPGGVTIIRKEP